MTIRTGVLYRICKRCEETFKPTGKCSFICKKCNKNGKGNTWLDEIIKIQPKNNCKFLKLIPGGKKICTNKFNYDYRSRKNRKATKPKRCETKYCPLDVK